MSSNFLRRMLQWPWPLGHVRAGIPLGNGTFGALLWGSGSPLKVTINRQDYWDHQGGMEWSEEATYPTLRRLLAKGDEAELRRIFEGRDPVTNQPPQTPTRLPMGRIELDLGRAAARQAGLTMATGEASVELSGVDVSAIVLREEPVVCLRLRGDGIARAPIIGRPAVLDEMRNRGYPDPERLADGWMQSRPGEPTMAVAWERVERSQAEVDLFVCSIYGTPDDAHALVGRMAAVGYETLLQRTATWWGDYWDKACDIDVPNEHFMRLYYLGLYKLAGCAAPDSPPVTLEGPWVGDEEMPKWSSDYHFNVDVQASYWPVFAANHPAMVLPLFQTIASWLPKLRENARRFLGIEDGIMLPWSVDDRGTCMGGWWNGPVDHGCASWTAHVMWKYYRHTLDKTFLRETAYPFMKGCMRVYEAMLEEDKGGRLQLPFGISPEWNDARLDSWGRNCSYALAMVHFLCRSLVAASEVLGADEPQRDRWLDIDRRLPLAATSPDGGHVYIWDEQPLSASHRHHSHLVGLFPLDVFDYHGSESDRGLIDASMNDLTRMGMGLWAGCYVTWAAILFARIGCAEMAELLIDIFQRAFVNEGYAALHDAHFRGLTLMCGRATTNVEGAMVPAAAVLELLAQSAHDVIRVFPAVPRAWREVSFRGLRAEGAFLLSAQRTHGATVRVSVTAEAGGMLRLADPFGRGEAILRRENKPDTAISGSIFAIPMLQSETISLVPTSKE